ncbi:VOC family protein [Alsobacter sp. SYSU M60028]|uniref:VOC family protein n=1 Tax=Alsobacter ponti TaxID=2962936 RepID=A0ABT1LC04_9HYPH|nr:VOC family protein [Alsobacter ponti]MCP8939029.1 VOC family protein [Alsobacter ponti]
MFDPSLVILYVADPARSVAFYAPLLGREPVESSPTFALFALEGGRMLGLWRRDGVRPDAAVPAGGSEIAAALPDAAAVEAVHAAWRSRGVAIAQPPTPMDFGHTFVALDPDGHRLRIFAPEQGQ